jgi:hypothetical protein
MAADRLFHLDPSEAPKYCSHHLYFTCTLFVLTQHLVRPNLLRNSTSQTKFNHRCGAAHHKCGCTGHLLS